MGGPEIPEKPPGEKRPGTRIRRCLLPVLVFLICLAAYGLYHLQFVKRSEKSGAGFYTTDGDEVQYMMVTTSLVRDHDLSPMNNYVRHDYALYGFYQGPPPVPPLVPAAHGRVVCSNTRFPFLLVPGFWVAGYSGAAATMILLSALAALFLFLSLRKLVSDWIAFACVLLFGVTYPVLIYSRLIYPETAAVFFLSLGLWSSLRLREGGGAGYAVLSGACAGALFLVHLKFVVLSAALLYLLLTSTRKWRRDLIAWAAPVLASAAFLFVFTWYISGSDIIKGFTSSVSPGDVLGGRPFWGVFGLYLDRSWGLFIFAPLYIIFLFGVPLATKKKDLKNWWVFIPVCIILQTLVVGSFGQWHGGVSPVPRYLVPLLPLFAVCAAIFIEHVYRNWVRVIAFLLLLFQLVLTAFIVVYPMSSFAMAGPASGLNRLIPKILGNNFISRTIVRAFPLFHPVRLTSGILLLGAWLVVLAGVGVFFRRWAMSPIYGDLRPGDA